jgi:hypothetical protein
MHPPDPEMRRPTTRQSGGTQSQKYLPCTADNKPEALDVQERLKLQAFCLARRFALSAPMAEAIAPLVYGGWRS